MSRTGILLFAEALRHRLRTFLTISIGVVVAVVILLLMTPSRYDATAIVGFSPADDQPASTDLVQLFVSEASVAATNSQTLLLAEELAQVPSGTLDADDVLADQVPETGLIELIVSDEDPQVAASLANSLAEVLVAEVDTDFLEAAVIKRAPAPDAPAAPARGLFLIAGILAGVGLGLGVVLGLEAWRPRIRNLSYLKWQLGLPAVATAGQPSTDVPPTRAMRLVRHRLETSGLSPHKRDSSPPTPTGVVIIGTEQVAQGTLKWVSEGLVDAYTATGQRALLLSPDLDWSEAIATGVVIVSPVQANAQHAEALAKAQILERAIIVVVADQPARELTQLRETLEATGIEPVGSVLVRSDH